MNELASRRVVLPRPRRDFTKQAQRRGKSLREVMLSGTMRRNVAISLMVFGWVAMVISVIPVSVLVLGDDVWVATHLAMFTCVHLSFVLVIMAIPGWRLAPLAKWAGVCLPVAAVLGGWIVWLLVLEPLPWLSSDPPVKPAFSTIVSTGIALFAICAALVVPARSSARRRRGRVPTL